MDLEKQKEIFKELYNKEINRVFRFVLLRVSKREEALDITEDAFYKLWEVMSGGKKIENLSAFVFKVTRNKIIDWYRKNKPSSLEQMFENGENDENTLPEIADPDSHTEIRLSAEASEVIKSFHKLGSLDAEIMMQRFVEDLGPQEIAERMGISSNNVSIRITRSIQKLREEFKIDVKENE